MSAGRVHILKVWEIVVTDLAKKSIYTNAIMLILMWTRFSFRCGYEEEG